MTVDEGTQIDRNRVSPGMGRTLALGGGGVGLVVLVLALLLGGDSSSALGNLTGAAEQNWMQTGMPSYCRTSADASTYLDCRVAFTARSLDAVWSAALPEQTGKRYTPPRVVLLSGAAATACGNATSAVGSFYCPADRTTYFDATFFRTLATRFGARGGPLAQAYVVAHEFDHHIQSRLGTIAHAQRDRHGPTSAAVRTELQADCFAGIWAHFAATTPTAGPTRPLFERLSDRDVEDAVSATAAVADDRSRRAARSGVNPEAWKHGSSEQRTKWFLAGYRTGRVRACNTYPVQDLNDPPALR
ncbi:neutral zinc metallopeptidase [Nocardia sp. CNY236]|uniref:KPN_02809 family neutral zinc metallopeptidase n=1 Tax=Nocardia sp. CNY236 TaxID=1169152 RepID=UPI00040DD641|nr:neutral zinc metallopeptidase [Nocardia sp. CNY236]